MANAAAVSLRRESDSELYFAHSPIPGAILGVFAGGLFYALFQIVPTPPTWAFVVVGLFCLAGILAALWRFDLRLDLIQRRYRMRRGFWPRVTTREGSLDGLRFVAVGKKWVRQSTRNTSTERLVWTVHLEFLEPIPPVCVVASRSEGEARQRAELFARKLRLPLADRTAGGERVTQPNDLDRPLHTDRKNESAARASPPGTRIIVAGGPTGQVILLPPGGFHFAFLILLLFGLAFAGFALTGLGAALGVLPLPVSGDRVMVALIATVFCAVGTGIALLAVFGMAARERIEESGGSLQISYRLFGRNYREKRLRKDKIEAVDRRATTLSKRSRGNEVVLRTDELVLVLGRDLEDEEQLWLRDRLVEMATR